jgi:hypothetical protein
LGKAGRIFFKIFREGSATWQDLPKRTLKPSIWKTWENQGMSDLELINTPVVGRSKLRLVAS